jgi:hypothetical protein
LLQDPVKGEAGLEVIRAVVFVGGDDRERLDEVVDGLVG